MVVFQPPSRRAPALDEQCIKTLQKRWDRFLLCVLPVESERCSEGDADEHFEVVREPRDQREEFLGHPALLILVLARPLQEREEIHGLFAQDTRFPNVRHP